MPVERDIDLNKPITEEDIVAMEEEANRLEALAEEAHENADSAEKLLEKEDKLLNEAVKKIEQLEKEAEKAEKAKNKIGRSIKEVNQLASHRSALGGVGGNDPFAESEQFGMGGMIPGAGDISGGRTGFGTGQEKSAMGGLQTTIQQMESQLKEAEKKRKDAEKKAKEERMANTKKLMEQRKMLGEFQKAQAQVFSAEHDPMAFGIGKLKGMVAKGGIYGLIALAVIASAEQIYKEVKRLYAPGGPFDIRKQMLDRDRELVEMDNILARRAGRVFFTSDVELQQGAPDYSNTERLRDRALRYQALHLGE